MEYVIEMIGIRKEFPGIVANDDITLQVREGEIHAILGENGAGKSTLMSILFGLYHADRGTIRIRGREVSIKNPNDAFALGIGMVHQHFQLVHNFTVAENIILGKEGGFVYDIRKASERIKESILETGLELNSEGNVSPYIINISTPLPSEVFTRMLDDRGFAISSGSACSNNAITFFLL